MVERMNSEKGCIIVVDMVNDFVRGKFGGKDKEELAVRMRSFLSSLMGKYPIIFTLDTHIMNDPEFKVWGEHCLENSWGSELCDELSGIRGHYLRKRHYDAFHDTDLDGYLRAMQFDHLIVMGVSTDICVLHTVSGAFHRYYRTTVIEDMCAAIDQERHREAISFMHRNYGTEISMSKTMKEEVES